MQIEPKYKNYKVNKYYKITDSIAIFCNNIYKVSYKDLNKVFFNEFRLSSFHNENFHNFWYNYNYRLIFANGLINLKTKELTIYSLDMWHKYIQKGQLNNEILQKITNHFLFKINEKKIFKYKLEFKKGEILFGN